METPTTMEFREPGPTRAKIGLGTRLGNRKDRAPGEREEYISGSKFSTG